MRELLVFLILLQFSACIKIQNEVSGLPPGHWNAVLKIGDNPFPVFDEDAVRERRVAFFQGANSDELFFEMQVSYPTKDSFVIDIINGKERIRIHEYYYGLDRSTAHDTIRILFPEYNSYIFGEFVEDVIQGEWVNLDRKGYRIPFVAKHGIPGRFPKLITDTFVNVDGRWEVEFEDSKKKWKAIGEFKQKGDILNGTFLTETGDYRYLAGKAYKNKIYLSTFDGSHAFLFGGEMLKDGSLEGFFKSGIHYNAFWSAKRNPGFTLSHPDSIIQFDKYADFQNIWVYDPMDGDSLTLSAIIDNQPSIISFMGTWCPNCKDELLFLQEHREQLNKTNLFAITFEKGKKSQKVFDRINKYRQVLGIEIPIYFGGVADKEKIKEKYPFLKDFKAYPTLLFLNSKGHIKRTHTGFSGPATSKYKTFKSDFFKSVTQINEDENIH